MLVSWKGDMKVKGLKKIFPKNFKLQIGDKHRYSVNLHKRVAM
ncbi:hypothetical protein M998_3621 [Providencia heimbachae ATCC 35613]|uniref:Uncharacterized protein n=1 Tax=Providencia heimbachae ATCC 35613 TaxID=1354272 RepID=A0A1B7JJT9_9GAMM|nr:hypothetical protein M998_3621 [Providencia heimbachae ATCC 35613]